MKAWVAQHVDGTRKRERDVIICAKGTLATFLSTLIINQAKHRHT